MKSFNFPNKKMQLVAAHLNELIRAVFTISFVSCLILSCGDESPEVETDRIRKLLTANTWKVQSVTIDGADNSAMYTGLTLKFADTRYTTANGGVVWPASGIWTFADETGKLILRGDDLEMVIDEITNAKLVLSLNWANTTLSSGRAMSISGEHVFVFER
jgi:hypothetical protein